MKAKHLFHVLLTSVMLAATAGMMTACTSNDDNPATPSGPSESVIKEKIVGKWKGATQDGTELTTNGRTVLTFNADGIRLVSTSRFESNVNKFIWRNKQSGTYIIEGNQMKNYLNTNDGYDVAIYNIDVIDDSQLAMTMQNLNPGRKSVYKRVTADYSKDLIGLWEVTEMTGEETYNDDNARLAFLADYTLAGGGRRDEIRMVGHRRSQGCKDTYFFRQKNKRNIKIMNYALCIMNYFVSLHTDNLQKWIYEHNQTSLFDAGGDARCRHFPVWMRRKYQRTGKAAQGSRRHGLCGLSRQGLPTYHRTGGQFQAAGMFFRR